MGLIHRDLKLGNLMVCADANASANTHCQTTPLIYKSALVPSPHAGVKLALQRRRPLRRSASFAEGNEGPTTPSPHAYRTTVLGGPASRCLRGPRGKDVIRETSPRSHQPEEGSPRAAGAESRDAATVSTQHDSDDDDDDEEEDDCRDGPVREPGSEDDASQGKVTCVGRQRRDGRIVSFPSLAKMQLKLIDFGMVISFTTGPCAVCRRSSCHLMAPQPHEETPCPPPEDSICHRKVSGETTAAAAAAREQVERRSSGSSSRPSSSSSTCAAQPYKFALRPSATRCICCGCRKLVGCSACRACAGPAGCINTFSGTPNYMAPEIICRSKKAWKAIINSLVNDPTHPTKDGLWKLDKSTEGYGPKVEQWAFGIVVYTLLAGMAPFEREHRKKHRFEKKSCEPNMQPGPDALSPQIARSSFSFPRMSFFPRGARELIKALVTFDPNNRPSWDEILAHPWLALPTSDEIEAASSSSVRPSYTTTSTPTKSNPLESVTHSSPGRVGSAAGSTRKRGTAQTCGVGGDGIAAQSPSNPRALPTPLLTPIGRQGAVGTPVGPHRRTDGPATRLAAERARDGSSDGSRSRRCSGNVDYGSHSKPRTSPSASNRRRHTAVPSNTTPGKGPDKDEEETHTPASHSPPSIRKLGRDSTSSHSSNGTNSSSSKLLERNLGTSPTGTRTKDTTPNRLQKRESAAPPPANSAKTQSGIAGQCVTQPELAARHFAYDSFNRRLGGPAAGDPQAYFSQPIANKSRISDTYSKLKSSSRHSGTEGSQNLSAGLPNRNSTLSFRPSTSPAPASPSRSSDKLAARTSQAATTPPRASYHSSVTRRDTEETTASQEAVRSITSRNRASRLPLAVGQQHPDIPTGDRWIVTPHCDYHDLYSSPPLGRNIQPPTDSLDKLQNFPPQPPTSPAPSAQKEENLGLAGNVRGVSTTSSGRQTVQGGATVSKAANSAAFSSQSFSTSSLPRLRSATASRLSKPSIRNKKGSDVSAGENCSLTRQAVHNISEPGDSLAGSVPFLGKRGGATKGNVAKLLPVQSPRVRLVLRDTTITRGSSVTCAEWEEKERRSTFSPQQESSNQAVTSNVTCPNNIVSRTRTVDTVCNVTRRFGREPNTNNSEIDYHIDRQLLGPMSQLNQDTRPAVVFHDNPGQARSSAEPPHVEQLRAVRHGRSPHATLLTHINQVRSSGESLVTRGSSIPRAR
eukprot:GHVT01070512.1.p1 GENE.GHVT01070512.1~~GHVT01070512.1.p1  ORF type:complete len:1199 (-),score=154.33 GHVT01070512.1:752-4348(-)